MMNPNLHRAMFFHSFISNTHTPNDWNSFRHCEPGGHSPLVPQGSIRGRGFGSGPGTVVCVVEGFGDDDSASSAVIKAGLIVVI